MTKLISPTTVREYSWMQENVDEDFIVPLITPIELFKLVPVIGQDKYDELIGQVETPPMTAANIALMEYITPMLAFYTLEKLAFALGNQITNTGVISKDNENGANLTREAMFRTEHEFKSMAESYQKRLIDYMCENNITVYQTKTRTNPIYFNGRNNNKKTIIS